MTSHELSEFVRLVSHYRDSGLRVFNAWVNKPPTLLAKSDPRLAEILKSLSSSEIDLINRVAPMIVSTSFCSLFEALELGADGYEFELSMKSADSKERISLINSNEDNEIRIKIDIPTENA